MCTVFCEWRPVEYSTGCDKGNTTKAGNSLFQLLLYPMDKFLILRKIDELILSRQCKTREKQKVFIFRCNVT